MKLSQRIKQYREENHLTQLDLANQLFVSKQAISKWENDKSLPDVSLYPVIADMLNISIEELMGIKKPDKPDARLPKAWMTGAAVLLVSLVIGMLLVFLNLHEEADPKKETGEFLISQAEKALNVKIPEIEAYDLIQYYAWSVYNNSVYPNEMYYFIFKDEILKMDETWLQELPQEMIDIIPLGSSEYPYICDYYKLVDLTNGTINQIELFDSKAHEYVLYCIQIEHKRLIAIRFEV